MHRRRLLAWGAALAAAGQAALLAGCGDGALQYDVALAQLQSALADKFPRHETLAGLLDLELRAPRLRLLAQEQRVGAELALVVRGALLREPYPGLLDLDFALAYDAAARSVVAAAPRVQRLQIDAVPERAAALLRRLGAPLAEQAFAGAALYRLREQDAERIARAGLQIAGIDVTATGLRVRFAPRDGQ